MDHENQDTEPKEITKNLYDSIVNIDSKKWIFTPKNDREEKLQSILKAEKDSDNGDFSSAKMLLLNFSQRGYLLLYYILRDIYTGYLSELPTKDYPKRTTTQTPRENKKTVNNLSNLKKQMNEDENYKKHYDELKKILNSSQKEKETEIIFHSQVTDYCRKVLLQLFSNDKNAALKYVYACSKSFDKNEVFLWDILGYAVEDNI